MKKFPDEPAILRALRTGSPYKEREWSREDTYELSNDEFTQIILNRWDAEKGTRKRNDDEQS